MARNLDLFAPEPVDAPLLTVLSYGGGQDSTALLELYLNNAEFRRRYSTPQKD